jgi:hypothetical protein
MTCQDTYEVWGSKRHARTHQAVLKAQTAQVRALMGATLGLLAFMLAFTFSAVMMLIMDLDRPLQSLFALDVSVMEQLASYYDLCSIERRKSKR